MDRKELFNKYGKFDGLDKVYKEFDPVNNPALNTNRTNANRKNTGLSQGNPASRRAPSLPSLSANQNYKTLSSARSKRGLWMSHKFKGKNVQSRDMNTKLKLNSVYRRFNRLNLESDKYFYPNPKTLIHPLKDSRKPVSNLRSSRIGQNMAQSELIPSENNLYAPETTKPKRKFRIQRRHCGSRKSLS